MSNQTNREPWATLIARSEAGINNALRGHSACNANGRPKIRSNSKIRMKQFGWTDQENNDVDADHNAWCNTPIFQNGTGFVYDCWEAWEGAGDLQSAMDHFYATNSAKQQNQSEEWWTENWPMKNELYRRRLLLESIQVHGGRRCSIRICDRRWINIPQNNKIRVRKDEPRIDRWKTNYTGGGISWSPFWSMRAEGAAWDFAIGDRLIFH